MISRDYTQEIGLPSQTKKMPRPLAYAVLAVIAVGLSFGIASVLRQTKVHNAEEKSAPTVSATAAPAAMPATPAAPGTP